MGSEKNRYFYYHKQFFRLFLVTSIIISIFLAFHYLTDKRFKAESLDHNLQIFNAFFLNQLDKGVSPADILSKDRLPYDNVRVTVIRLDGVPVYDNVIDVDSLGNLLTREEITKAICFKRGFTVSRPSYPDNKEYFFSAMKGDRFIVRTAIPYTIALKQLLEANMSFLWLILLVVIMVGLLGYFGTRRLSKTILRLNGFAEKAERGEDLNIENMEFSRDELGEISEHIIRLYTRLQHTIEERDKEHQKALQKEHEKECLKRDLTTNINHELKTPVASVMVCLETLLNCRELPEEKKTELLERSYSNCERLRHLLEEVSSIIRMDEGKLVMQKEHIVLNQLLEKLIQEKEPDLRDSGMRIHLDFRAHIIELKGNFPALDSLFRNLIDNAEAYSEGQNIYISLLDDNDEFCRIAFEDDGKGVEESHLSRLFERFYRVESGRSRHTGGTGLGLSIVKHAVQFHGGEIFVSNGQYGGLRFEFSLKKQ